jgi:hypothetical protein
MERFKVYEQLGDPEAANNVKRIEGTIAENDEFRREQQAAIDGINVSRQQADRSAAIANDLALGTEEAIERVVAEAGPAIEEFTGLRDAAAAKVDELTTKVERTTATINDLTTSAATLTDKQVEALDRYNSDVQKYAL